MALPTVLDSAMQDFGLEHLLVLFMLATSFLLVAITFERIAAYMLLRVSIGGASKVMVEARKGSLADARKACGTKKSAVTDILVVGLDRAVGAVRGEPGRAMMREKKRLVGKLKARTWILATAGALMPFVGLFGTVIGVMASFQAIGESGQHQFCFRITLEPRQGTHGDRERGVTLLERFHMLLHQQSGGRYHRHLLLVLNGFECCPHRNLGFYKPHITGNEAIHRDGSLHVGLHLVNGGELVGGLHERKRLL